jgi:four helix bundle protein
MEDVKFNFEELRVYQKSLDFADFVYEIAKSFPKNEKYALTSQYTRAAVSISLNIAEGAGDSDAQFNRFLQIAQDSIKECVVCSTISKRQRMISDDMDLRSRKSSSEMAKMITKLQQYLKNTNN